MQKQQLILVRGLPGSGKSTLARMLVGQIHNAFHYEADMYFIDDEDNYKFNQQLIGKAHEWCQCATKLDIQDGLSVIVSNTFTTMKEMRPYFEIANKCGVTPTVFLAQSNFGNLHDVPEETIQKMKNRFCYDISPLIKEFKSRFDAESVVK